MAPLIQDCTAKGLVDVRALFREYGDSLGSHLCFQDFEKEMSDLPGEYAQPTGRLLLATENACLAGCVAVRRIDDQVCEMKRLYVRPAYRGAGLGRKLVEAVVAASRRIGYGKMHLDTLPSMKAAIKLYHALGFVEIPQNKINTIEDAMHMELDLMHDSEVTSVQQIRYELDRTIGRIGP